MRYNASILEVVIIKFKLLLFFLALLVFTIGCTVEQKKDTLVNNLTEDNSVNEITEEDLFGNWISVEDDYKIEVSLDKGSEEGEVIITEKNISEKNEMDYEIKSNLYQNGKNKDSSLSYMDENEDRIYTFSNWKNDQMIVAVGVNDSENRSQETNIGTQRPYILKKVK